MPKRRLGSQQPRRLSSSSAVKGQGRHQGIDCLQQSIAYFQLLALAESNSRSPPRVLNVSERGRATWEPADGREGIAWRAPDQGGNSATADVSFKIVHDSWPSQAPF